MRELRSPRKALVVGCGAWRGSIVRIAGVALQAHGVHRVIELSSLGSPTVCFRRRSLRRRSIQPPKVSGLNLDTDASAERKIFLLALDLAVQSGTGAGAS